MKQKSGYGAYKRSNGTRGRGSYAGNVSAKAQQKHKMVLSRELKCAIVCLLIPPLGVYLLWSDPNGNPPVRIAATIAACAVMYILFTALLPASEPTEYQFSKTMPVAVTEYATAQGE